MTGKESIFKVLIIGNSAVGKSNFMLQYTEKKFCESFLPTIGVDFKIAKLDVKGNTVKLNIWDTAGQERFTTINSTYYRGAHGAIFVYDITEPSSFHRINMWVNEVANHAGSSVVKLLVGNKCDLEAERKVSTQEGKELAERLGARFLETSAKKNINVDQAFRLLTEEIYRQWPDAEKADTNSITVTRVERKSGCC